MMGAVVAHHLRNWRMSRRAAKTKSPTPPSPARGVDHGLVDCDGWLSDRTTLSRDKIRARFQLKVRNLLDPRDLLPQKADPTGVNRLFTVQPPRQFILTTTFDL